MECAHDNCSNEASFGVELEVSKKKVIVYLCKTHMAWTTSQRRKLANAIKNKIQG